MNAAEAVLGPPLKAGYGDRPALLWRDRRIDYAALAALVNRAGNALRSLGVAPENRVLLMMKDTPLLVAAYLGAIRIGAVAVAFNVRAAPADLLHVLCDSRAGILLIDREFLPVYEAVAAELGEGPRVVVADADAEAAEADGSAWGALVAQADAELEPLDMADDDMAFWIYTSGTTGGAKAAVHVQKDVLTADAYLTDTLGVTHGDILFATSKLFFAYALGTGLFGAFRLGATTALYDGWPTATTVAELIEHHRPNVVFSVPTLYRNMLAEGAPGECAGMKAVRHYVSAGERLPDNLWHQWRKATGVEIVDGMGTSETIYMILTNRPGDMRPGSSGKAAPTAAVKLADEDGRAVEPGVAGILWVRMPSRADRYWNHQAKSQEAFHGPWFRTGDMYTVDSDGFWYHQGRFDDMLKVSGQWVSPAEIEEAALSALPLRDAAVVGVPDGDGLVRTTLFAVGPDDGFDQAALEQDIRQALTQRLSAYKCPKWVRFVDAVPRTATGKAQRYKLRMLAQSEAATQPRA